MAPPSPLPAGFVPSALAPLAAAVVASSSSSSARWAPRRAGVRPCVTSVRRRPAAARRLVRTTPTAHDGCGSIWGDEPPLPAAGKVCGGGSAAAAAVTAASSSSLCGHGHDHSHDHDRDHGHDHGHGHAADRDGAGSGNAWSRLLGFILESREHLGVAAVGAGLLAVAVLATPLGLPPAAAAAALGGSLALTGLPAVVASARTVVATRGRGTDVDVLMTLAAAAAVATGAPIEGALLTALYAGSHAAERAVTRKARGDLDALRALAPPTALRLSSADSAAVPVEVPLADVAVGDWLLVRAGEVAPADGTVASGSAFVSAEHLTGEAAPRAVSKGDPVPAGARAGDGALVLRVVRTGADSTIARITALVTEATRNRPAVTRVMDRFGVPYSRAVLLAALAVALLLPFAPPPLRAPGWGGAGGSISRGLGVLVAASPCALVIGAPVAFLSALSAAARRGVLVKGGAAALEAAATTATVAFDKTGTLTTGQLRLVGVDRFGDDENGDHEGYAPGAGGASSSAYPSSLTGSNGNVDNGNGGWRGGSGAQAVAVAAALERNSVHPMATAILDRAAAGDVAPPPLDDFLTVPGHGLQGRMAGNGGGVGGANGATDGAAGAPAALPAMPPPSARVRFGRVPFVAAGRPGAGADVDGVPAAGDGFVSPAAAAWLEGAAAASSHRGESVAALGVEGVGAAGAATASTAATGADDGEAYLFRFADAMRPEAAAGVAALKAAGLRVVMLTGDNPASAAAVAATVGGLDEVVASLTPAGKLDYVTAATAALAASRGRGDAGLLVVGDGINDAPALSAATVGVAVGLPTSSAAAAAVADVVLLRGAVTDVPWLVAKARSTRTVVAQNLVLALGLMVLAVVPVAAGAIPLWQAVLLHEGGTILVGLNGLRLLSDQLSSRF